MSNRYTDEIELLSSMAISAKTKKERDMWHQKIDKVYEAARNANKSEARTSNGGT